jgi:limonene-1,2-epoxide hydrolase
MPDVREVYEMATKHKPPEPGALQRQQERQARTARTRRAGAFALAAAICVMAAAFIIGTRQADTSAPADVPPSLAPSDPGGPERIAERFLRAFARFDADAAMSAVADDEVIEGIVTLEGVNGPDALALDLAMLEAMGYEQIVHGCDASGGDTVTVVTCPYDFHALRSDEIGLGPYGGSRFTFTVRDDAIVGVDMGLNFLETFSAEMWEPFAAWVSRAHPEDAAVMYTDGSLTDYALTPASIRLWEQRSREYVGVTLSDPVAIGERFMEARNAHDIPDAVSLLADDGANVRILEDNAPSALTTMGTERMDLDALALALEAERAFGVRFGSVACGPIVHPVVPATDEANIECTYVLDSHLRRLDGSPPKETFMHLGVHDQRVTFLSFPYLNASFPMGVPAESWQFIEWLQTAHPDVGAPMEDGTLFHTEGQELQLNLTPHAVGLLERYLGEYERSTA